MSNSLAFSLNLSFVNHPFYEAVDVFPFDIIIILVYTIPVLGCSFSSFQKLEVADDSIAVDLLLSLVAAISFIFLYHFLDILCFNLGLRC